jgi:outer membrane protein OmpA-like peptidoglycan-associated protein
MPRPMLDSLELQQVQQLHAEERASVARHGVPGLEGDFLQDLGRRATRITLNGVLTGATAADGLKQLREKFKAATPVPFVSDIATATAVDKVLIEALDIRELAGKPARFEYGIALREFIPPPPPETEPPPPPPPPPPPNLLKATLVVEVIVEGDPAFDFSTVTVTADDTPADGSPLVSKVLSNRTNNEWTEPDMAPGRVVAKAVVPGPDAMSGSAEGDLRAGETTRLQILLRKGELIAKAFVVHYRFDRAFVEPCLLEVLRDVNRHAAANPTEKIVVVGHTDLVGSGEYNQALSERRARGVFGLLTFATSDPLKAAARQDWNELRKPHVAGSFDMKDGWGTREYQYMLQELGFYQGNINEQHDAATDAAVRAFQRLKGLQEDGIVGDDTWAALIDDYLGLDSFALAENRFLPNAKNGCNGGIVRWLGCGEQDPVRNTEDAWRPNRRTEILFVNVASFPCEIAKPVTFDKPVANAGGTSWCLGPGDPNKRCCFVTRNTPQKPKWLVQPARLETVTISGTIVFDDGTPVADAEYALISPEGEYLHSDATGKADLGERPSGPDRGRPIPARADTNGRFSHPDPKPAGVYIMEIFTLDRPEVARTTAETPDQAMGNVICMRLES